MKWNVSLFNVLIRKYLKYNQILTFQRFFRASRWQSSILGNRLMKGIFTHMDKLVLFKNYHLREREKKKKPHDNWNIFRGLTAWSCTQQWLIRQMHFYLWNIRVTGKKDDPQWPTFGVELSSNLRAHFKATCVCVSVRDHTQNWHILTQLWGFSACVFVCDLLLYRVVCWG